MEITIVCQDTRGGVQPYAALADGLVAAGHGVRAVAPAEYAWLFERVGVLCLPLQGMDPDRAREVALEVQGDRGGGLRRATAVLLDQIPGWARQVRDFADGSGLLTGGIGGKVLGVPVAASLGVPWVRAELQPIGSVDGRNPGVFGAGIPAVLGTLGNLLGQALTEAMVSVPLGPAQRTARQALDVHDRVSVAGTVYGISPSVMRPPRAQNGNSLVAGYWFDQPDGDPLSAEVADFLDAPQPVVSIGFGSMVTADPAATRNLVLHAVRDVGARAILVQGAGALEPVADDGVLSVSTIDYRALFPRVAATVHHGGAGTTAQAFAAGVPTIILPFGADQPFWARRAHELGVAPRTRPLGSTTRAGLATALDQALTSDTMRRAARALAERIRSEDGVTRTAQWYSALRA